MTMDGLVLAIDLGTSGVKVALVDGAGAFVATSTQPYEISSPHPGWAETNPADWMRAIGDGVTAVTAVSDQPIVAVGIDGQMHGLVVGRDDEALRPAMLWPDSRAMDQVTKWRETSEEWRARLANPVVPGMLGPMASWLAEHEPETLSRAEYLCSPKDWVRRQLTGDDVVTDFSDASATLAWDVSKRGWHTDLLDSLGVPSTLLPEVRLASEHQPLRRGWGLNAGIPVSVGCADTAATLLATQLQDAEVLINLGTGLQVAMAASESVATAQPRFHAYLDADGDPYSMVAPQNGGLALSRVVKFLGADWAELYGSLETPLASPVRFTPRFAPDRFPVLRDGGEAAWEGLSLATTRNDLLRSALEGVAMQAVEAIRAFSEQPSAIRFTGGGTRDPRMRQLLCDVTGLPGRTSTVTDATALGAGILGFRAAGISCEWPVPREDEIITPR